MFGSLLAYVTLMGINNKMMGKRDKKHNAIDNLLIEIKIIQEDYVKNRHVSLPQHFCYLKMLMLPLLFYTSTHMYMSVHVICVFRHANIRDGADATQT